MGAVAGTGSHALLSLSSTPLGSSSCTVTAINIGSLLRYRHMGLCRFRVRVRHRQPNLNAASSAGAMELKFQEIREKCSKWQWKDHIISYLVVHPPRASSSNPPLLLVHGFGASIAQWRRFLLLLTIPMLNFVAIFFCCSLMIEHVLFNLFIAPNLIPSVCFSE